MRARRPARLLLFAALTVLLAGCGSVATSSSSSSSSPAAPVSTGKATVKGTSETVLTTTKGMTLYYFTPDTATKSACTGGCAKLWPPLTATGTALSSPSGISGTFAVVKDANGNQVAYNGHLLYTFAKDTAAGQAKGQGLLGKWFVATPGLKAASSSSSSSGNGY